MIVYKTISMKIKPGNRLNCLFGKQISLVGNNEFFQTMRYAGMHGMETIIHKVIVSI